MCAALRTTPATLLGDYSSLSFSAGQLGHVQERQAVEDRQMVLTNQFYTPVYRDWLLGRWMMLVRDFPEIEIEDLDALLYPTVKLRRYQILDKSRLVYPILKAWDQGIMTYAEVRAELGFSGADLDEVMEEWKENRASLGLPTVPSAGQDEIGGKTESADGESDGKSDDDDKDDKDDDDGAD